MKKALEIYREYENNGIYECAVIMPRACSDYGIHRFESEKELRDILKLMVSTIIMVTVKESLLHVLVILI